MALVQAMMSFQLHDDGRVKRVDWTAPAMEHFDGHVVRRWDAHMFVFRDEPFEYRALIYTERRGDRTWSDLVFRHRCTLVDLVPPCRLHTDCLEAWDSGDPRGRKMALACAKKRPRVAKSKLWKGGDRG